jgi:hypothetical protein
MPETFQVFGANTSVNLENIKILGAGRVIGDQTQGLRMLSKHSTTQVHRQPLL